VEKRRRLEGVWEKAGGTIGCDGVPGVEHEARVMVEGLRQIREMIKETEGKIQELCEQFPEYEYLLTIPGFGPDVSAKVLGVIGDPDRFQNGKQVLKLAGLDLSADRSGRDSDIAIPEISKRGKADLRYALYQAALIASTRNQDFMRYEGMRLKGWPEYTILRGKVVFEKGKVLGEPGYGRYIKRPVSLHCQKNCIAHRAERIASRQKPGAISKERSRP
jgi:hypothetical protein